MAYGLLSGAQAQRWAKPLLGTSAFVLSVSALIGLAAQTVSLAGSFELGLTRESLQFMAATGLGKAALVRAAVAFMAIPLLLVMRPKRGLWIAAGLFGAVAAGSLAWMGHGAATEGSGAQLHLVADIAHALAAALWIGALVAFVMLLVFGSERATLRTALIRFSALGVPLVVVLVASGLVNSWFLIGPDHLAGLMTTQYGRLLLLKLVLFGAMLILAALNRWRHTPAIVRTGASLAPMRTSIVAEASLAVAVLALVAWFGVLEPPTS